MEEQNIRNTKQYYQIQQKSTLTIASKIELTSAHICLVAVIVTISSFQRRNIQVIMFQDLYFLQLIIFYSIIIDLFVLVLMKIETC